MTGRFFQSGIMLVTSILISMLIIILFISSISIMFSSSSETKFAIERESALYAAKAGYQEALNEIEKILADKDKKSADIPYYTLPDWKDCNSFVENGSAQYRYAYKKGVIVAGGRVRSYRGNYVYRFLRTDFLIQSMGVTAKKIEGNRPDPDAPYNASISSVFSSPSQFPFDVWMGIDTINDGQSNVRPYSNGIYRGIKYSGEVVKADAGGFIGKYGFNVYDKDCKIFRSLKLEEADWDGRRFYDDYSFSKYITSGTQEAAASGGSFTPIEPDVALGASALGIPFDAQHFKSFKYRPNGYGTCLITYPNDTKFLTKNNLWLVPYNRTVRFDGDLLLSGKALLVVTGNLVVNGNIRGNGAVIVFNKLTFAPVNREHPGVPGFESAFDTSDKLVLYSGGGVRVINNRGAYPDFQSDLFATMPYYLPVRLAEYLKSKGGSLNNYSTTDDFKKLVAGYINETNIPPDKDLANWLKQNGFLKGADIEDPSKRMEYEALASDD